MKDFVVVSDFLTLAALWKMDLIMNQKQKEGPANRRCLVTRTLAMEVGGVCRFKISFGGRRCRSCWVWILGRGKRKQVQFLGFWTEHLQEWCCHTQKGRQAPASASSWPSTVLTSSLQAVIDFKTLLFPLIACTTHHFRRDAELPNLAYVPWRWRVSPSHPARPAGGPHKSVGRGMPGASHCGQHSGAVPWSCQLLRISCHPRN